METEKVLPIKTFHFTPISEKLYKIIGSKYFEGSERLKNAPL